MRYAMCKSKRAPEKFNEQHQFIFICTPYYRHISGAGRNMPVTRAARQSGFNLQCQGHNKSFRLELTSLPWGPTLRTHPRHTLRQHVYNSVKDFEYHARLPIPGWNHRLRGPRQEERTLWKKSPQGLLHQQLPQTHRISLQGLLISWIRIMHR